jgi:hypothetical protein
VLIGVALDASPLFGLRAAADGRFGHGILHAAGPIVIRFFCARREASAGEGIGPKSRLLGFLISPLTLEGRAGERAPSSGGDARVEAGSFRPAATTTGQATSSGETESSRASSTGQAGPAVHAASTWAGAVLISFSSSMSASPTCSWRPTRIGSVARSTTWLSGMAGPSRARTMRSKPGLRTTRRSGALTSPDRSFDDATRGGQRVFWAARRQPPDWGERRLRYPAVQGRSLPRQADFSDRRPLDCSTAIPDAVTGVIPPDFVSACWRPRPAEAAAC